MKNIYILGMQYTIEKKKYDEDPSFKERNIDGYCDGLLKNIIYCDLKTHPFFKEGDDYINECEKETLRHEIIHAFLNESGLMESSAQYNGGWATNEEMVDWIAIQFPKISKVFIELNIL